MWLSVRRAVIMGFALAVGFMAGMSLIGYMTGMEHLSRWTGPGTVPMALNTALCFLCVSITLILLTMNGGNGGPFRPAA